ncbi:MAG: SsrA-binding protein SmpB [Candidatus Kapaibacterium sp.]|jgi:SsrA-binding protein
MTKGKGETEARRFFDHPKKEVTFRQIADNRRARFEYFFTQELEAGIVLTGTEVKSLRDGKAQLSNGYAHIDKGELWLEEVHIGIYKQGNQFNHEEKRRRKLLIHAKELAKLETKLADKGSTLIPLRLYFKGNKVKVMLGLGKGKKSFDKRETIKSRDVKREMSRDD